MGYPIEGVERKAKAAPKPRSRSNSISPAPIPAKGEQVFNKCAACHNADKGGANQLGPNLWGVLGEPIGQGQGFAFSDALQGKGGNWDWDSLGAMAEQPQGLRSGHQDDLRRPQQSAGPRQRHRLPQRAQRCAAAAARRSGRGAGRRRAAKPGAGTGNGPQKAEKEPVLNAAQAGKSRQSVGGEGR